MIAVPSPLLRISFVTGPSPSSNSWSSAAQWTDDFDGRGENGRRLVKIFEVPPKCPSYQSPTIGRRFQLIYGAGQGYQQALSTDANGNILFDKVVGGEGDGNANTILHSDFWDIYLPKDYCPEWPSRAYAANDGGVYQGDSIKSDGHLTKMGWGLLGSGIRAHNAHELVLTSSSGPSGDALADLAYPVSDNSGWWRDSNGGWTAAGILGDGNYAAGDIGSHFALLWRQLGTGCAGGGCAVLHDFDGGTKQIDLNNPGPGDLPTQIQAIQSLSGTSPFNDSLDMVMLVNLPLAKADGSKVADPPGSTGAGSRLALIRNDNFNANPDGPLAGWQGWSTVSDQLPAGTQRFWVSGGHASPTYFAWTGGGDPDCNNGLLRLTPSVSSGWTCLTTGLTPVSQATHGPAFVDAFDPDQILIDSAAPQDKAGAKLQISTDGGAHFCDAPVLTGLVTQSGDYTIVDPNTSLAEYRPGDAFTAVSSTYHGVATSVPSTVAFNRHGPLRYLVASPFTGLYIGSPRSLKLFHAAGKNCQTSGWEEPVWRDLTPTMPSSRSYVSSVGLLDDAAVVASEGRGVYALSGLSSAPLASWFSVAPARSAAEALATLRSGDGSTLAWEPVTVSISTIVQNAPLPLITDSILVSDSAGAVTTLAPLPAGRYVVDLRFVGDGATAGTAAKFFQTVQ